MKYGKILGKILFSTILMTGDINAQAASISLNVTSLEIYAGQTLDANVFIDPSSSGIAGAQIDVLFDGNTLEPIFVREGNLLSQNGANTFFSDLAPGSNSISNIVGVILENSNVTNPDIFAVITFRAKNAGTSFIELRNVKISDSEGDLLKVIVPDMTMLNIISNKVGNSESTGGSGGSGGGGGGGISGENFTNIEIKEKYDLYINKDITTSYVFKKADPIISVNITGNTNAGEITVAVEVLKNVSSLVKGQAPDTVYKNFNIWAGTYGFATPTNIKHAEITFRVPKSWMESNSIDPDSITMMHYYGIWESLPTRNIGETANWNYYEASATRFSPYAIAGKKSSGKDHNSIPTAFIKSQKLEKQESFDGNAAASPENMSKYFIIGTLAVLNAAIIYKIGKPGMKRKIFL